MQTITEQTTESITMDPETIRRIDEAREGSGVDRETFARLVVARGLDATDATEAAQ
jgi:DNA-binding transcriptional regulator YiaG